MLTTSSFLGSTSKPSSSRTASTTVLGVVLLLVLQGSSLSAQEARLPPESPLPPLPVAEKPPTVDRTWLRPVELDSVRVRLLDEEHERLAGPEFRRRASNPVVLVVHLTRPLDPVPRTSWPVVVLNGRALGNTWMVRSNLTILWAFLPNREPIRDRNKVEVYWVGNEELTRTREPVFFFRREVPRP